MKSNIIKIIFVLFLTGPLFLKAQDIRTTKTKVADVLGMLPATGNQLSDKLFLDLLATGDEGLGMVTDQLQPNGNPGGVPARYAVSLLTNHAKTPAEKATIEKAYLYALSKATHTEVKAYLIANLKQVGSDTSVSMLAAYIGDKDLADPALSALVTIGTPKAGGSIVNSIPASAPDLQQRLVKAVGEMKYQPALATIIPLAHAADESVRRQALWALAQLADAGSYDILRQQAERVGYKRDPTDAMQALLEYQHRMASNGNAGLVKAITTVVLSNTPDSSQQQFRLACLANFARVDQAEVHPMLIKEVTNPDEGYRRQIVSLAESTRWNEAADKLWMKEYKKAKGAQQAELMTMLAHAHPEDAYTTATLVPALSSKDQSIRMAACAEIGNRKDKKYLQYLVNYAARASLDNEIQQAKTSLLQLTDKDNCGMIVRSLGAATTSAKVAMIQVVAERRAIQYFDEVAAYCTSAAPQVRQAAFEALTRLSSPPKLVVLLNMLTSAYDQKEIMALQAAIKPAINESSVPIVNEAFEKNKIKVMPVLGNLSDKGALEKVTTAFYQGSQPEKDAAFVTLCNWGNDDAIRALLAIRKNSSLTSFHDAAFASLIAQVNKSSMPDDQKLLMLREIMTTAATKQEKTAVLRSTGGLRSFLSLVFVAGYLDDPELSGAASRSAMQIALPTADAKPGLSGTVVQDILRKVLSTLTGPDSQYDRIDIATYLEKLPHTKGYESIFNGKDLRGWQGLVENPIARNKMTPQVLAAKQKEADAKLGMGWTVKDGEILFNGDGSNLCTIRQYGDFEIIVDWKISKNGDSGIYLRGTPQIQIWDTGRIKDGAAVGSGGLYNNEKGVSKPLVVADNPVGEWNTSRIIMIGERVTSYLNGILVVDNVVMENYWDRTIPIFMEGALELQAHGPGTAFRDIYVKDLSNKPAVLSAEEQKQGFQLLFNGKDLNDWVGNKTDYVVEDTDLAIYPTMGGRGNLYTGKEYSDFIFRFEFQLTPGANNGLGIHAPLEGDAAYLGKEIQIIDNSAPVYAKLEPYQYHGSVYGVIAARRDFLKPVGEWNEEEVYVKGDYIKVTLNGTVITEGDMKKASRNGTVDHKDHPGLSRHSGHIGFLGHGSVVKFRNIRIKELTK